MSRRFYVPDLKSGPIEIGDDQAHHLRNVMRVRAGQQIELFDGNGYQAAATIEEVRRNGVTVHADLPQQVSRELERVITCYLPLPKADRARMVIEKLTELGVDAIVPLITEHSVFDKKQAQSGKWAQYVIEACKQSGRNQLLKLETPVRLDALLQGSVEAGSQAGSGGEPTTSSGGAGHANAGLKVFADFSGSLPGRLSLPATPASASRPAHRPCIDLLVGPEGGLTDGEVQGLQSAGWLGINLGPAILRLETAAMVLVSLMRQANGLGGPL